MNKLLVLGFIAFMACQNEKPNQVQLLDNQVMKIHDEAMAKSGYVLSLKKLINNKLDSTENISLKDSLQAISSKLYQADRLMLDWMHQYNAPNFKSDTAERYLTIQLEKINKVHQITFESINQAETILKHEK